MANISQASDWQRYKMVFNDPHQELEPLEKEIAVVEKCLEDLVSSGILPNTAYDKEKMGAMRKAVRDKFDIPWTGITPRMQRLLYAINAIFQPKTMVAMGVFCGNTFISNAGAAVAPGACYEAENLIGLEIRPEEANRARENVAKIAPEGKTEIIAADGLQWLPEFTPTIDLLYLDADGRGGRGKAIYLDLLLASKKNLREGSLILAHNSVNSEKDLEEYLTYVRNPDNCRESVNMIPDDQGLEVSVWKG